jgi:Na+-translocating ferredoxin:NAD+ oxidoreductase RnfE subunit
MAENKISNWSVLTAGWIKQNPTFVQVLGMCPVLAV